MRYFVDEHTIISYMFMLKMHAWNEGNFGLCDRDPQRSAINSNAARGSFVPLGFSSSNSYSARQLGIVTCLNRRTQAQPLAVAKWVACSSNNGNKIMLSFQKKKLYCLSELKSDQIDATRMHASSYVLHRSLQHAVLLGGIPAVQLLQKMFSTFVTRTGAGAEFGRRFSWSRP
jgi:hypothetical protein